MSDFSAGAGARPAGAGHWVGVSICYEDAFGEEVREALPEADMLVNLSNDAWFGDSLAPHQHLPDRPPARAGDGAAPAARHQHGHFRPDRSPGELLARLRAFEEVVVTCGVQPDRHDPYARQRGRRGARPAGFGVGPGRRRRL